MLPENQAILENFLYTYLTRNAVEARSEENRLILSEGSMRLHYLFAKALHETGAARTFDMDYEAGQAVIEFRDVYAATARNAVAAFNKDRSENRRAPWESDPDDWKADGGWQPSGPSF